MPALNERATDALESGEAARLGELLAGLSKTDVALTIDGRNVSLDAQAGTAVLDLLQRLADGHAVVVASTDSLLTTSQAAELIGISPTYLLRLANNGVIPVEYRGTHRRFRLADATRYLESSRAKRSAQHSASPTSAAE